MEEPKDFHPIVYSNKLKTAINIKTNKKQQTKQFMDQIVSKPFLKNYFSLMPATK